MSCGQRQFTNQELGYIREALLEYAKQWDETAVKNKRDGYDELELASREQATLYHKLATKARIMS